MIWRNGRLLPDGWTVIARGLCWVSLCECRNLYRRVVNGYEIKLCTHHVLELERKAEDALGYSTAEPPDGQTEHWPWRAVDGPPPKSGE